MAKDSRIGTLRRDGPEGGESSGWISPTGNWWAVSYATHSAFARERKPNASDPVSALERAGWVHVSDGTLSHGDTERCYRYGYGLAQADHGPEGHDLSDGQLHTLYQLARNIGSRCDDRTWLHVLGYVPGKDA